jgi:hypothetical protein
MNCPTPCCRCGEIVELDSMTFRFDCDCRDDCTHGLCRECVGDLVDDPEGAEIADRMNAAHYGIPWPPKDNH